MNNFRMTFIRYNQELKHILLPRFSNLFLHLHYVKHVHSATSMAVSIPKQEIINKLEQLSLLNIDRDYGISVLQTAIAFTEQLRTTKILEEVEPMYSPFEKQLIPLRNDNVENTSRKEILMNAAVLEEEYFVAPLQSPIETQ
ncbi:glutamyl-tRNA(Gln) amidotransferase subunit C, mitochondrial [Xylocopa sonorina]|uniref:glutamyl-tRNA(Gln) amidotransferase subunit C, mitochondrial n=1 Tax=Xylocopa sonorina TaxID=1818115 RepID=UPI00403A80E9